MGQMWLEFEAWRPARTFSSGLKPLLVATHKVAMGRGPARRKHSRQPLPQHGNGRRAGPQSADAVHMRCE